MNSRSVRPRSSLVDPGPVSRETSNGQRSAVHGRGNETGSGVEWNAQYDDVVVPSTLPVLPRLFLASLSTDTAVLQGGWWPHSYDPLTELPGLILALCARYGSVRDLHLHAGNWLRPFTRLAVDAGVVNLTWSRSLDPALMIATTGDGKTFELLVVAPHTDATTAKLAMTMAADPTNTRHAHDILAALA
jgi:hypothetical protein